MRETPKTNRLIHEKSPYLLQHAANPVDWYPWGDEAFKKARSEDKPLFLSVGYSTCHWCHVMEEESFVNPAIAKLLNEYFISIKVDREERPDVDQIYMRAVQALSGSGGWPISVFLNHDLKPFYGGTYFPPEDRWGRPGFSTILKSLHKKWVENRMHIDQAGEELMTNLKNQIAIQAASRRLGEETLKAAYGQLDGTFDVRYGGFGRAPKFPRSHDLSFLLRYWKRTGEKKALGMVETTLTEMARGGIYDHLGGGFHRYSTDHQWHVPHFEKMLYDQALLAKTYLEAYQATGREEYARVAREVLDYVRRDMRQEQGGFYSAEDADSAVDTAHPAHKKEGAFYVWSAAEIHQALGDEGASIFDDAYGVDPEGNAEKDPQGEFTGKNILKESLSVQELSEKYGKTYQEMETLLRGTRARLLELRNRRPRPFLDDKILTDWNGLMISALAYSARILGNPEDLKAASQAADFILKTLKRPDGRLLHRWREGQAAIPAFLDDYAFLIQGLCDLYEAGFEARYLEEALRLLSEALTFFWDDMRGAFFFSAKDAEKLLHESKELYDGAIPSGNSVMTLNLLRLARMTMNRTLEKKAEQTLDYFSASIAQYPSGFTQMLAALDFVLGPSREIVFSGHAQPLEALIKIVNGQFLPNKVVLRYDQAAPDHAMIEKLSPFTAKQKALEGRPTVYVCKNYVCDLPAHDPVRLEELLKD